MSRKGAGRAVTALPALRGAGLAAVAFVLALAMPSTAVQDEPLTVRVEMNEFSFRPATIHLSAGRYARLAFVNRGQIAHQFETNYLRKLYVRTVSGPMTSEVPGLEFLRLDPGGTARIEFLPRQRGRFVFVCKIEGHREAGMHGMIVIR